MSRARDKVSLLFITKAQGPVAMARATSVVAAVTLKLPPTRPARACDCFDLSAVRRDREEARFTTKGACLRPIPGYPPSR